VLPYLPKGFLIFFSFHSKVGTAVGTGLQRYYQVGIGRQNYLVDPEPRTRHGLGNFVNAAVACSSTKFRKYANSLRRITKQEMHIPNCQFSTGNSRNGRVVRLRYPFYYKVTKKVFPGEELLTEANYGGDHIYPTEDIIR
jgi:hypothetical protein